MYKLTTLVLALLLCACGGGSAFTATAQPVQSGTTPPLVVLYGDSTQYGGPGGTGGAPSATLVAQPLLTGIAQLRNDGAPGTTAVQLLNGTDGRHAAWATELASHSAQVVVTNHGINDWRETEAEYRAALTQLVYTARAQHKTLILETPNPVWRSADYDRPAYERRVIIMREVAFTTGAPLCDVYQAVIDAGVASETDDGLHPMAVMYQVIGAKLAQCVKHELRIC